MKAGLRVPKLLFIIPLILFLIGAILFAIPATIAIHLYRAEAIHTAVENDDIDRVEQILNENPARLEQKNRLGLTPLLEAALDGREAILKLLIRRGADVNAKWDDPASGDGAWNALHVTAIEGRVNAAKLLIRSGTDVNWKSVRGETPLDVAAKNHHWELVELLRANGGVSGKER
jgi:ankyrin repeat protein